MSAVSIRNPDPRGRYPVTYIESDEMDESFSELRADVRNLQVHVAYLKAGVDTANTGIEFLREKLEQYRFEGVTRGEAARLETSAEFKEVRGEISKTREHTQGRFDSLQGQIVSTQRWALGIYLGGTAGLFFLIAHGFKWF